MANKLDTSILFIRVANLQIRTRPHAWHPPTDLFETEDGYTVRIEIAGMKDEAFSIQYSQNMLVVSGRRPMRNQKCAYHRMEIPTGEFFTTIQLPGNLYINAARADYDLGFLTIHIPRNAPVNIEVNTEKGE